MTASLSRSSISSPLSLTNRLLDPHEYQQLEGLEPEVEADLNSDKDAPPLSPKAKAKQAYQVFCKSAKDFYVACAGPNRIDLAKKLVDIKRDSDMIKAQYTRAIAKRPEDLSDDEKAVIKQKLAYDKAVEAFVEFQKSTDEDTRNELIQAAHANFQEMCIALSPTTTKKERSLNVMTVKLNVTTEKLEQQAGKVFSQFLSFGNRILTEKEEKARIASLEEIAITYNCFYGQTLEIELIKNPPKRPSAILRALKAVQELVTPESNIRLWY